jgi:hypothetical protein
MKCFSKQKTHRHTIIGNFRPNVWPILQFSHFNFAKTLYTARTPETAQTPQTGKTEYGQSPLSFSRSVTNSGFGTSLFESMYVNNLFSYSSCVLCRLHVAGCMLHVACCMLHVALLVVACYLLLVTCWGGN